MTYVDAYLVPVRTERRATYATFSAKVAAIYKEFGALRVVDCWQDAAAQEASAFHAEGARASLDAEAMRGFPAAADARPGETVVLSWTEWPDKATRDEGLARALADPRMQPEPGEEALFEGRRLIAGGFTVSLET